MGSLVERSLNHGWWFMFWLLKMNKKAILGAASWHPIKRLFFIFCEDVAMFRSLVFNRKNVLMALIRFFFTSFIWINLVTERHHIFMVRGGLALERGDRTGTNWLRFILFAAWGNDYKYITCQFTRPFLFFCGAHCILSRTKSNFSMN